MTTPSLENLVTAERRIRAEVRCDPVVLHAAKDLVDNAFVGLPGLAAAYVREVFTMIEHVATATYGRAFVESWTDIPGPTSPLG